MMGTQRPCDTNVLAGSASLEADAPRHSQWAQVIAP
jgi:hypothetical protein